MGHKPLSTCGPVQVDTSPPSERLAFLKHTTAGTDRLQGPWRNVNTDMEYRDDAVLPSEDPDKLQDFLDRLNDSVWDAFCIIEM